MVREGSTLACLAVASAFLASLVAPLGSEAAAVDRAKPDAEVAIEIVVPLPPEGYVLAGLEEAFVRRQAFPSRVAPPPPVVRARVPVGCERVISGLVRSAAASQIASCLT